MKVIIARHAESTKNINKTFATLEDSEPLTNNGIEQAKLMAVSIREFIRSNNYLCCQVFVANSSRAIATGSYIANSIDCELVPVDEFISIKNNESLVGIDEEKAKEIDSLFMNELELSRAGIFNAYLHTSNLTKDMVINHEKMAYTKYLEILSKTKQDVAIFVMHHSSLTAILINIAREYYHYPKKFYGNIECELGNIFLIDYHDMFAFIEHANIHPSIL